MEKYAPAYPTTRQWKDTINFLTTDKYEKIIIKELQQQYLDQGFFREPIRLSEKTDPEKTLLNGTHRIVALHLLGIEDVKTEIGFGKYDENDINNQYVIDFSFTIPNNEDDEKISQYYQIIRSFPYDKHVWIENLGFSQIGDNEKQKIIISYGYENLQYKKIITEKIRKAIVEIFPHISYNIHIKEEIISLQ